MDNPRRYFVSTFAETLLVDVYRFIGTLPASEVYNLVSQMRRAATSIDDNIREGVSAQGDRAAMPFLYHAHQSAAELCGHFRKCRLLTLGDQDAATRGGRKAGRMQIMLFRLIRAKECRLNSQRSTPRRRRSPRRTE